ncbi:MAG: hypothetical protein Fur002_04740 [Anaerolineales bacterium]
MDKKRARKHRLRHAQASLRDTLILLKEFRAPLFWFSIATFGGGVLYHYLSQIYGEPLDSLAEAIYTTLSITFLQPPNRDFPHHIALQLFYFIMPLIGLITLAQGLADFGSLFFNRRARSKEWEMAVASTLNQHIILVGLGHLGYRVALKLHEAGEQIAVIELNANSDTVTAARALGVPVINEDAARLAALEAANLKDARVIILASQNDALNLQIALKARSLQPKIKVIIRIFDEDFAHALQAQFGFTALSATEMAAPVFAAAASGIDITSFISIEGQALGLARLTVKPNSALVGKTVGEVEAQHHLSVVLQSRDHQPQQPPPKDSLIAAEDTLAALGEPDELSRFVHENE